MSLKDNIQENQYKYPYHYIPKFKNGFKQHVVWTWGINYASTLEYILNYLKATSFKSLVDVGCGDGRLVREIANAFSNKKVLGIDNSEKAIALAKAFNPDLSFQKLDILKKLPKRVFDIATLIEVFEHIPKNKCQSFTDSIYTLVKKNGYLLITVPHRNKALHTKHYQHFDKKSLLSYFKGKFDLVDLKYFEKQSLLSFIIRKLLINSLFIINNKFLNTTLYRIYKKYCFFADSESCGRIFVLLKKI